MNETYTVWLAPMPANPGGFALEGGWYGRPGNHIGMDNRGIWWRTDKDRAIKMTRDSAIVAIRGFREKGYECWAEPPFSVTTNYGAPNRDAQAAESLSLAKTAEIERLRGALKRIAANRYGVQGLYEEGASDGEISAYWSATTFELQRIARSALTPTASGLGTGEGGSSGGRVHAAPDGATEGQHSAGQEQLPPLGHYCRACDAIPKHGYCNLAGCPMPRPANQHPGAAQ